MLKPNLFSAILLLIPAGFGVIQPVACAGTVQKGIVILVQFPDVKENISGKYVQTRFSRDLNNYIKEMSYGTVSLEVDVTRKWHTMPGPVGQYKISSRNLEVDKTRVKKLIDDALNAADDEVDYSQYSFAVVFMGVKLTDYGMIGLCGYPGMLGWSTGESLRTKSGQAIKGGVAIFSYQAHLGTLFHDIAHILGGVRDGKRLVPCLYDHDLQAKPGPMRDTFVDAIINMGYWDVMSCHYYKRNMPPPGLSSWTKLRLNWIDPSKVRIVNPGEQAEFELGPIEKDSSEILTAKLPVSATEYYLIENRQPVGFDKNLPGSGVLILHADDTVAECRHGSAPVRLVDADPSVPHLEGAAFDVGKKESFADPKSRIRIQLKSRTHGSYRILVNRQ